MNAVASGMNTSNDDPNRSSIVVVTRKTSKVYIKKNLTMLMQYQTPVSHA